MQTFLFSFIWFKCEGWKKEPENIFRKQIVKKQNKKTPECLPLCGLLWAFGTFSGLLGKLKVGDEWRCDAVRK